MAEGVKQKPNKSAKSGRTKKAFKIIGFIFLFGILIGFTVNALLCLFLDHYYPTFGGYRLFAIVSDSMEPEIPKGNMIVGRVPESSDEITVGTVITFEVKQGDSTVLITHRVIEVRQNESGISYTTRGDNANGADSVRPTYDDVVGIYTGNRCGFFGYLFGFLQSTQGAIALIVILLIVVATCIVVHFINLVTVWRSIALAALKKGGSILADTKQEQFGVIADVIGIVSKEPNDKSDLRRKDKKLKWFIKTGALPRRPYHDDLDENADMVNTAASVLPPTESEEAALPVAPQSPSADGQEPEESAEKTVPAEGSDRAPLIIKDRSEKMTYKMSLLARIIRLDGNAKEWYSLVKNELLSFRNVRVRMGEKFEVFSLGRKTAARLTVRGKTLCLYFAGDPTAFAGSKYAVEVVKGSTPCLYRIRSARRARYACELIDGCMSGAGAEKNADYKAQDYYLPYEDIVSLMEKGLVKRNLTSTEKSFKIVEIPKENNAEAAQPPAENADGKDGGVS